jgi:hemerythrin superfamily protein
MHLTHIAMILCYRQLSQAPNVLATKQGAAIMAKAKAKRRPAKSQDAIALLKADHRQVEKWFKEFEKSRTDGRKLELATDICNALKVHTTIEEEIFYPAFLDATEDTDLHHEAEIEHDAAKKLIAEIDASSPDDEYYGSKVKVLSEMIKHHVKEEEQPGGMFAEARKAKMDLQALGEQMAARKGELQAQIASTPATSRRGKNGILERIANAATR